MANETKDRDVLIPLYGSKAFVKIKQCLDIDKVCFSFVDKADSKKHVDVYMEADEFGATLMADIKNHTLLYKLEKEKEKGEKYPKEVYTSPVGGNATGNNGNPISRYFTIAPGIKTDAVLTGLAFPAEKNETGAFIKLKDSKAITTLRVPCSYNDLRILQYRWSFLERDYMTQKYTMANMKSDRPVKKSDDVQSSPEAAQEAENEEEIPYVGSDSAKPEKSAAQGAQKPAKETKPAPAPASVDAKTKEDAPKKREPVTKRYVAITALEKSGDSTKTCKIKDGDTIKFLVCLTNKITDERFPEFEKKLAAKVEKGEGMQFNASVVEKDDNVYLINF